MGTGAALCEHAPTVQVDIMEDMKGVVTNQVQTNHRWLVVLPARFVRACVLTARVCVTRDSNSTYHSSCFY